MKKNSLNAETKLAVLLLAKESRSVTFACFSAGISRSAYYKIKRAFDRDGLEGLQPKPRQRPKMPNAFSKNVVDRILEETRNFPTYSYDRIAARLRAAGLSVSGSGVQKVWKRRNLTKRNERRLLRECPLNTNQKGDL